MTGSASSTVVALQRRFDLLTAALRLRWELYTLNSGDTALLVPIGSARLDPSSLAPRLNQLSWKLPHSDDDRIYSLLHSDRDGTLCSKLWRYCIFSPGQLRSAPVPLDQLRSTLTIPHSRFRSATIPPLSHTNYKIYKIFKICNNSARYTVVNYFLSIFLHKFTFHKTYLIQKQINYRHKNH